MLFQEGKVKIYEKYYAEKERWKNYLQGLMIQLEKSGEMIGDGKTAEVKIINNRGRNCLKIVDKNKIRSNNVRITNYANEEIDYLDELSNQDFLKSIGINDKIVPEPIISTQEKNYSFLLMEQVQGLSLKDYLENKNLEKLPPNLDWEKFFEKLTDIVVRLNQAGIHHRDLHEGNIMINEKGQPIIIDFGDTCKSFYSEDNPYREETIRGLTIYTPDIEHLKIVKQKIFTKKESNDKEITKT